MSPAGEMTSAWLGYVYAELSVGSVAGRSCVLASTVEMRAMAPCVMAAFVV